MNSRGFRPLPLLPPLTAAVFFILLSIGQSALASEAVIAQSNHDNEETAMTQPTRREIGLETIKDVYAGDVVTPDEGYAFSDIMLEQLFAELWTRDTLSMRDKRILLLGIIAEKGEPSTFKIQVKASLKRGEMKPEEARELLLFIAQYAGYPRAAALIGPIEEAIAEAAQSQ